MGSAIGKARPALAQEIGSQLCRKVRCYLGRRIDAVFQKAADHFGQIDVLGPCRGLCALGRGWKGRFYDTTREGFRIAMDISAYSLVALAQRAHADARRR